MAALSLGLMAVAGGRMALASGEPPPDGYLTKQVVVLVYAGEPRFDRTPRGLTIQREVSLFEGYLWRNSMRHLSVESSVHFIDRTPGADEFRNYGEQYGFLLDRSPKVESDLRGLGVDASSLILLYVPPPDRPARLAGRTFYEGNHSSIPLKEIYFQGDGFFRPLHLVMAHEFLHQIDLDFGRLKLPGEFLDPDGAGLASYPACIDPGGGDISLRTLLQFNRDCQPVRWDLLAPAYGAWVPR